MNLAIVDNGGANMNSLIFAVQRLGVTPVLTASRADLDQATHIILPGVGHAKDSMNRLRRDALTRWLRATHKPVLGICLGMQLLYSHSEEGDTPCLDIVPGTVKKMPATPHSPSPHMGWNQIEFKRSHPLLNDIANNSYMYFVHSYAAPVNDWTLASTEYQKPLAAITVKDNFMGVQFHPERSGATGARLLDNFMGMA